MIVRLNLAIATACMLRRFRRDRTGSAAIQFAMVGIPFLLVIFAIVETALMFFATQAMETATQDAARLIMTGQAQMGGMSASTFKTQLCSKLNSLMNCAGGLDVEVKAYANSSSVNITNPISGGTYNPISGYDAGHAGDYIVVRAAYQWPMYVTGFGYNMSNIGGNKRLLLTTAAFRNEPGPF